MRHGCERKSPFALVPNRRKKSTRRFREVLFLNAFNLFDLCDLPTNVPEKSAYQIW
jgi:hypothetical protein